MLDPEDFDLPTVAINDVHMVVSDNVRLMFGEKVLNPKTGMEREPVYHYAVVMSIETAARVGQNLLNCLSDHKGKQFATQFVSVALPELSNITIGEGLK